eukprot:464366-Pyramimonas_sp.AAC.1
METRPMDDRWRTDGIEPSPETSSQFERWIAVGGPAEARGATDGRAMEHRWRRVEGQRLLRANTTYFRQECSGCSRLWLQWRTFDRNRCCSRRCERVARQMPPILTAGMGQNAVMWANVCATSRAC